jgi:hypothetical protein
MNGAVAGPLVLILSTKVQAPFCWKSKKLENKRQHRLTVWYFYWIEIVRCNEYGMYVQLYADYSTITSLSYMYGMIRQYLQACKFSEEISRQAHHYFHSTSIPQIIYTYSRRIMCNEKPCA